MSFLTNHLLGSASSLITNLRGTPVVVHQAILIGDFQEYQPTNKKVGIATNELHSPHSVRLSN
jgi:hypothetical protein